MQESSDFQFPSRPHTAGFVKYVDALCEESINLVGPLRASTLCQSLLEQFRFTLTPEK
jgi:hypothetical protein